MIRASISSISGALSVTFKNVENVPISDLYLARAWPDLRVLKPFVDCLPHGHRLRSDAGQGKVKLPRQCASLVRLVHQVELRQ